MDGEHNSDLSQSRTSAEIFVGTQKQEKIKIPPSVSKPAKRKRVDVGGKMYEDELMVLNVRLKIVLLATLRVLLIDMLSTS